MRKPTTWVPTMSDTNQTVQSQKTVRGWKFFIYKVVELYYPSSENKGADQLRSYCEADLRLSFRLCRLFVVPCGGSLMFVLLSFLPKVTGEFLEFLELCFCHCSSVCLYRLDEVSQGYVTRGNLVIIIIVIRKTCP